LFSFAERERSQYTKRNPTLLKQGVRAVIMIPARKGAGEMARGYAREETKDTKTRSAIEVISMEEVESRLRGQKGGQLSRAPRAREDDERRGSGTWNLAAIIPP